MVKADKDDGIVQPGANNSPETSSEDHKIIKDSEEKLRALVSHYEAERLEQELAQA